MNPESTQTPKSLGSPLCSALAEVMDEWKQKEPRDFPVRFAAMIHGKDVVEVADWLEYMAAQLREKGFSDIAGGGRDSKMVCATHFKQNAESIHHEGEKNL